MSRVVTFLSLASNQTVGSVHHSAPAASAVTPIHPSAALVVGILIAIGCVVLVMRLVNFVLVSLVSQIAQIAAVVFTRALILMAVIAVLITLLLAHI